MPVHEFGIIDNIDFERNQINYEPLKYNCISVDDAIILSLKGQLSIIKPTFIRLNAQNSVLLITELQLFHLNHYHYFMMLLPLQGFIKILIK